VLEVAGGEAEAWLASEGRSPASLERLIEDWRSRFRLVEVG
jgi:hypothetical protein